MLYRVHRQIESIFAHFGAANADKQPDELRRARLIVAFSLLGVFFGAVFGGFYLLIGHFWGGAIIGVCCALFGLVPQLLRNGLSTTRAGNHYCLILLSGFLCLCWTEGGMHGHALAWLVIVPLCALLLTSRRGAYFWSGAAFLAALVTAGVEAFGISPPIRYPMDWHVTVSTMGYAALIAFLFALGLVFETGRKTAHDQMEKTLHELAAANSHLKRLNDEKSEFLGIAAHDLRSPLTVVMGRAEMIKLPDLSLERKMQAADSILKEAKRMRTLISDLLDLNAIEEGRLRMTLAPTRIAAVLDGFCENHRAQATKKNIVFQFGIDPELVVMTDEKSLLQILDNLISNAIKFTKPGGRTGLDVWSEGAFGWIKVSDTGPGLSEEDQSKLFGRFTRLSARPTGGESSHGLGLSIVKRLVDTMGGEIKVESALGKGTSFVLGLPLAHKPGRTVGNADRLSAAPQLR